MDELLAQFLIEGPELTHQGAEALLALERRPTDREHLDDAFRAVHTLKGSVGLFDLPAMAELLHAAEDVLVALREGRRAPDRAIIGRLLGVLDQTQAWLEAIESAGVLPPDAMASTRRLVDGLGASAPVAEAIAARISTEPDDWAMALARSLPGDRRRETVVVVRYEPDRGCYFSGDDPLATVAKAPGLCALRLSLRDQPEPEGPYDPYACDLVIEAVCAAPVEEVRAAFRFAPDQVRFAEIAPPLPDSVDTTDERRAQGAGRTLRIEARRIDALANVADELVAAKTRLAALVAAAQAGGQAPELAGAFATQSEAIERLVGQAHQQVTALRMAPLRAFLRRFRPVVRDLANSLGKDVDLIVEGEGIEADRDIVEGLFEPLTHLLRNAIDHGVESAEERLRAGKPERAVIMLSARERGGRLSLTVRDDGRGIDPAAIRAAAARRELVDGETLAGLDDNAVVDLVFMPGFSTADRVTTLSGRGVGMDAVRAAAQRLGGTVSVSTEPGAGVTVELLAPLTVSLTQVMVVTLAEERYGVPITDVLETVRLRTDQVFPIRAGHAFNWRDSAIPLLPLASLVGGGASLHDDQRVLVVRAGAQPIGLAVDAIVDRLDLAVRPLGGLLAGFGGLTGAALLGDGQVLMILDPEGLAG